MPVLRVLLLSVLATVLGAAAVRAEPVDFSLPDLDGREHRLSDYRGKWVLVNYWATWCPPCLEEIPELEIFHSRHQDEDAVVLGVNMEEIGVEELRKFVDDQFVSYPILRMAPSGRTELGRILGLPTSFLVSPEGEVVAVQVGPVTAEALEAFITSHGASEAHEESSR
jgi:thiol-disulfide isomerase/thioredoxin